MSLLPLLLLLMFESLEFVVVVVVVVGCGCVAVAVSLCIETRGCFPLICRNRGEDDNAVPHLRRSPQWRHLALLLAIQSK